MIENWAIATMDGPGHDQSGAEYRGGHVVVSGGRITAVGEGPAAARSQGLDGARRIDGTGCLATPGLVNTHHHLYQWLTQGRAQQASCVPPMRPRPPARPGRPRADWRP